MKSPNPIRNAALASVVAAFAATMGACASTPPSPFFLSLPDYSIDESFAPEGGIAGPAGKLKPTAPKDDHPGSGGESEADQVGDQVAGGTGARLRCRILYLAEPPTETGLRPAATGTDLVADLLGSDPLPDTPHLTANVLFADGPAADAWLSNVLGGVHGIGHVSSIADRSFALPLGASYRLGLTVFETIEDPRDWLDEFPDRGPIPRRLGVEIFAGPEGPTVAVEITDISPDAEQALRDSITENPDVPPATPPPAHTETLRHEAITLAADVGLGGPIAIRVPSPFDSGNGAAFAIVIESVDAGSVFVQAAEAQARVTLDALAQAERAVPLTDTARESLRREEALDAFKRRGGRAALLLLAEEADAPLCADLALSADAGFLGALASRAFPNPSDAAGDDAPSDAPGSNAKQSASQPAQSPAQSPAQPPDQSPGEQPLDPETIGWLLDATAWSMMAEAAIEETISPELEGVFLRRAGALARFPDLIQDLLSSSAGDLGAFERGLVTEHLIALEDSSVSVRLRAHDWLLERGRAVEGFAPLSERSARRAALEAHREKARTRAGTGTSETAPAQAATSAEGTAR